MDLLVCYCYYPYISSIKETNNISINIDTQCYFEYKSLLWRTHSRSDSKTCRTKMFFGV